MAGKHGSQRTRTLKLLVLGGLIATLLLAAVPALAAKDFGQRVPGQHIYDRTGLLTDQEIAGLEQHAAAVEQAGAPVVVYLQARDATYDATYQDARDLMDAWDLQSAPGAHDGLVLFFNLKPGDLRHGQVVLFAGEKHYKDGSLPESELKRIYNDVMLPDLKQGRTAEGITAGLDAAAHDLTVGPPPPPPPSRVEQIAADLSRGPLSVVNVVALLGALVVLFFALRTYQARPTAGGTAVVPSTMRPDDREPAEVSALVNGRISDAQVEGTLLWLASQGILAIEPVGKKKVQIRLLGRGTVHGQFKNAVWDALARSAGSDGVVSSADLGNIRRQWGPAREVLRRQLEAEGLYREHPGKLRMPVYLAGAAAFVVGAIGIIIAAVGGQPWGLAGPILLSAAGIVAWILAYAIPDTTASGEAEAASWRGYRAGITAARRDRAAVLDLDEVMPYAVALGVVGSLDKRLKEASEAGYSPLWLGNTMAAHAWHGGFYPYWTAFHTTIAPTSSGGGFSGGASAGGGGAGGSF